VAQVLTQFGAPDDVVQTLRLVASELASNALVDTADPAMITVEGSDDGWGLQVTGGWQPPEHLLWDPAQWRLHTENRSSGRGLGLVRTLVDEVEVHDVDRRAVVDCWIRA
jgi:anti-sigma regulatory factor (Ser/Thr protein kinase)